MNTKKEAIIFDLGGVLLNIDYQLTEDAFVDLGLTNFKEVYSQMQQSDLFDNYEKGKISSFHFINQLLEKLPAGTSANQVVHAWNKMLLDFPASRLEQLKKLASKYRLFLLSNTNDIHIEAFKRIFSTTFPNDSIDNYFEKVYFSSDIGMRKPDGEAFEYVCKQNQLNPENVLFVDDSPQHVEGAKSVGIDAILLQKNADVFSLPFFLA
jgi:putative hydrolase of the HAD superfamily